MFIRRREEGKRKREGREGEEGGRKEIEKDENN